MGFKVDRLKNAAGAMHLDRALIDASNNTERSFFFQLLKQYKTNKQTKNS